MDSYNKMEDGEESRNAQARDAYRDKDVAKSKKAHQLPAHQEPNTPEAKYLKPVVFGGLDGISTVFAFLAGAVGADLSLTSIIALGCAQLFAGAFGMGFGEYLSSEAERQVATRERDREAWEVENYPEGEVNEMVQIYMDNGLTREDATVVASTLSKYKDFWVDHMMLTEIGMMPPDGSPKEAMLQGLVMFLAFMSLGALPLVAYVLARTFQTNPDPATSFAVTCSATTAALFFLGVMKAKTTESAMFMGGFWMAVQGLMSAGAAYLIGNSLPTWLDIDGA